MSTQSDVKDRSDERRFGGAVRRYAQVGTAMAGLGARVAGEKLFGVKVDQTRMAQDLRDALGGLKGPLMKVAQIMSTIPDALPEEYAQELAQLQSDAPQMGWPFVRRRMQAELGADWQSKFASFEKEASAAASLGQVHRAVGKDGQALACKLQYPDMASVVEADLNQLKVILSLYRRYDSAIDSSQIQEEIAERLREELDYINESNNMRLYSHMLSEEPAVEIPKPIEALTTRRLLTMNWLEGEKLLRFAETADLQMRNRVARNLFQAWYIPFYRYGVIHGDPHLGNYSVRPDGTINLLDFGSVRVFRPSFVRGVIDLYKAVRDGDAELAEEAYRAWGFVDLKPELIEILNLWATFLYGPLMENRPRLIQEGGGTAQGRALAEKVHAELKRLGGIRPPREFVLMERAAMGLGGVFLRLRAEVNWYELFIGLIDDFDEANLVSRQTKALQAAGLRAAGEEFSE